MFKSRLDQKMQSKKDILDHLNLQQEKIIFLFFTLNAMKLFM